MLINILKYLFNGNSVEMGWNETNEEIARREADGGKYVIEEIEMDAFVAEPTADEILNTMQGVTA